MNGPLTALKYLVAPVSRTAIALGKVMGGALLAVLPGRFRAGSFRRHDFFLPPGKRLTTRGLLLAALTRSTLPA